MTSLNKGDNIEEPVGKETAQIAGDPVGESMGEEIEEIDGDTLYNIEEEEDIEITGHELDEPDDEEISNITGNELDEPSDSEGISISENELRESKNQESKSYKEEKNRSKVSEKTTRGKKTLFMAFVIGIGLLAMGSYYFSQNKKGQEKKNRVNIFPIPYDQSYIFEPFIIPFQEKKGYTYISLTLSFELSNMELKKEIIENKEQLRGMIYELLGQGIQTVEDARSLEKVKKLILDRANAVLTSGEVYEAIITDFSLI